VIDFYMFYLVSDLRCLTHVMQQLKGC